MKKKKKKKGFSLLELLIVVAIILIIATIAIPSLLRSRQSTNESAGIGDMRTINTGEVTYASSNAQNYGTFQDLTKAGLLDTRFVAGGKLHGFVWTEGVAVSDPNGAVLGGAPPAAYGFLATHDGTSARYDYESGTDAVVRYGPVAPAGKAQHVPVQ